MQLLPYLEAGATRIPLSTSYYLGSIAALIYAQNVLAGVKPTTMSTSVKRILATPLILTDLLFPVFVRDGANSWNLLGATIPFMAFLRFLDLFWVAPMVQGVEAFATQRYLHEEFWSCLRKFPKTKEEEEKYVKDKKFYHIIPHYLIHAIISDIINTWFKTFTEEELLSTYTKNPIFFFGYFCMVLASMCAGFNANGYLLRFIYVLIYEKGSYCSAQWRRLMEFPLCATSLGDIWSFRWHQALKPTWRNLPFAEVRILSERVFRKCGIKSFKRLGIMAAALSVFMISGVLHEYLVYVNAGLKEYRLLRGEEMAFFTIHGVAVMVEKFVSKACGNQPWTKSQLVMILRRVWTLGFACLTIPLFLRGFMVINSWYSGAFTPFEPQILGIMHQIPGMHRLCGSLF
ncbi:hypothetical protein BDF20DRAFT_892461 [Mycotypha africana]|uniref:uncharacterized protein n=1 Tax=Mycotypha africana TaxID=64632 RepID=UPI0023015996|nr:uncharacterized protein BDF20DRAFT_892461 [Mycotypha africana]KAI8968953.1 hypothetical protein BDF20DRAFT_892461 [Mycotypha africana]